MKHTIKVALIGNPNVGKTSIFNILTGLKQKVGNYPGITVERKTGSFVLDQDTNAHIIDVPGTYSINATSKDEEIALDILFDKNHKDHPDVVVVVAEVENLKRNLVLFSQIKDLGFPTLLVINMADRMEKNGISIDVNSLEKELKNPVILFSARKNKGEKELKEAILNYKKIEKGSFLDISTLDHPIIEELEKSYPNENLYKAYLFHTLQQKLSFDDNKLTHPFSESDIKRVQHKESIKRHQIITKKTSNNYTIDRSKASAWNFRLDRILTHKIFGYIIFFAVMLLVFQSIFEWASAPMDFIDERFASLADWTKSALPEGKLTDLISEGIIAGIGGIVIFIPQIAILFLFISLLEESGYMSRVVFLMDRIMRPFGLSGKSVVPLVSGVACAIPAIMSARNIENTKERLITILVTPFATCSARIPVYIIIISLVIPDEKVLGGISLQALVMTLMYLLGFFTALLSAWVMKFIIKNDRKPFFIIEMPTYKLPLFSNVFYTVWEKTKTFVIGAGKIILALSIILWFLGSHGPDDTFGNAEEYVKKKFVNEELNAEELENEIAGYQLETSYIGIMGHTIEPVFRPLGYDWKISIAVLTSFAAREVFVGNLATLYSIGSHEEETDTIVNRMRKETRPDGTPTFTLATGVSLLLFYAFAMQCIATLAITRKETNSWKWTFIQVIFMTGLAYFSAFIAFQILS